MLVRPDRSADRQPMLDVVRNAFGVEGDLVAELVLALREAGHMRHSLVAEEAGRIVGHVQLNRSWIDARERLVEVLVLSPLSVHTDHQRRGVGTTLIRAAIEAASDDDCPALFLEGDPRYYSGRGFKRAGALGFGAPSARIPDAAFQAVLLPRHEPWMTGALVYCDPFWTLDCVGLRDPILGQFESRHQ